MVSPLKINVAKFKLFFTNENLVNYNQYHLHLLLYPSSDFTCEG